MRTAARRARGLSGILLCLLLLLCLAVTAAAADAAAHTHGDRTFLPLPADAQALTESGSYYLSGDITLGGNLVVRGEGVIVDLCLNGHMLTGGSGSCVIQVTDGAVLNIRDCYDPATHPGTEYTHSYRGPDYRYRTHTGGLITGNGGKMSGVRVSGGGALHFYGGAIAGCAPSGSGGGIYLEKGTASLYNGARILNNQAAANGGGVYVSAGRAAAPNRLNIYGGEITGNVTKAAGAGVYLSAYSEMTMSGGLIGENTQTTESELQSYGGGAVYMAVYSRADMSGGRISGNCAASACGGVFLNPLAEFCLSGQPVIADNRHADAESNLCVLFKAKGQQLGAVLVTGALEREARIGLTYTDAALADAVSLVRADGAYNGGAVAPEDFDVFFSDDPARSLLWSEAGELEICVGRVHAICGAVCSHGAGGAAIHGQVVLRPLGENFSGGHLPEGNYYLETDVVLSAPVTVSGGTVTLCLNGHELRNTGGRVFQVNAGGVLNLCDCYAAGTHAGDAYVHSYKNPQTKADVTVRGGLVSGSHSLTTPSGGVAVTGGRLNLFGGTVACASGLGGVCVTENGSFRMFGGAVNDCWSTGAGGGIYADASGTVALRGGNVLSNRARSLAGGVCAEAGFEIEGNVRILGNIVGAVEHNVYLRQGTFLTVTGPVSGMVGITMEAPGVFTTGGAAPYVRSFKADPLAGSFAEVQDGELRLSGYGIRVQPDPDSRTVIMKSPEEVASYQWYALRERPLTQTDVSGGALGFDAAAALWRYDFTGTADSIHCFTIRLAEGDTLRFQACPGFDSVSLMERVAGADGDVLETSVYTSKPDYEGFYDLTAGHAGSYEVYLGAHMPWEAGDSLALSIACFSAAAEPLQTGASYTGASGYHLCRIAYADGITVLYSEPFQPGVHSHGGAAFTPVANRVTGEVLLGEAQSDNLILTGGRYFLAGDVVLPATLVIPAAAEVELCLNGHRLLCRSGTAISVAAGGVLRVYDCAGGASISGNSALDGGGLLVRGTVELYGGSVCDGAAARHGGGVYVARGGRLRLCGDVHISGNQPDNLYLAAGQTVEVSGLAASARIGVNMETPGVFTVGTDAYLDNFFADRLGTFLTQSAAGELELDFCAIVEQPTAEKPTVTVSHGVDAAYQWYAMTARELTDEADSRYDAGSRRWTLEAGDALTFALEAGEVLRIVPAEALPEDALVTLSGVHMHQSDSGAYWLAVQSAGEFTLSVSVPSALSAAAYARGEAIPGQTGDTLSAAPGAYLCRIRWSDGMELWSQPVLLPESVLYPPLRPAPPLPFEDVEPDAWYYQNVRSAYQNGWMLGTDATHFSPELPVTRGMLVTVLWRLSGMSDAGASPGAEAGEAAPFVDVPDDAYYAAAVRWAAARKIAYGVDSAHFCPEQNVTRAQAAAFLRRWALAPEAPERIENWSEDAVRWAADNGLLLGMPDGQLAPERELSRAQLAALLSRLISPCMRRPVSP